MASRSSSFLACSISAVRAPTISSRRRWRPSSSLTRPCQAPTRMAAATSAHSPKNHTRRHQGARMWRVKPTGAETSPCTVSTATSSKRNAPAGRPAYRTSCPVVSFQPVSSPRSR